MQQTSLLQQHKALRQSSRVDPIHVTLHLVRDAHLRKADFFDVDRYPTLTFHGRRVEAVDAAAGHYTVVGDLTVRGVTREVALETHLRERWGRGTTAA